MSEYDLQEDHPPVDGIWWNPSSPSKRWHGVLSMRAASVANLRLVSFEQDEFPFRYSEKVAGTALLHGTTSGGRDVTLVNCLCRNETKRLGGVEASISAHHVIFGRHLTENQLSFDKIQIEIDSLDDWLSECSFEKKDIRDSRGTREIQIILKPEHSIPFAAPCYRSAEFYLGYTSHTSAFRFTIESRANLQMSYEKSTPLRRILSDLHGWRWFFSLACRQSAHARAVTVFRNDVCMTLSDKAIAEPLGVWISSGRGRRSGRPLHGFQMNFSYHDVSHRLSETITKWHELRESWSAVLHRFFATFDRDGLQVPEKFLFRVQAIESLYRVRNNTERADTQPAIEDAWMKAPAALRALLGKKKDLTRKVRENRNYYTHYNPEIEREGKVLDFDELFQITQGLGMLLLTAILKELGLPNATIERSFARDRWASLIKYK